MRVAFVASEAFPFAKVGGLADVVGSLPQALKRRGLEPTIFLPWYWGVAALFLGYLLQYVGHQVEGNDVGEWALLKRLLGLPYVAISPRYQKTVTPK